MVEHKTSPWKALSTVAIIATVAALFVSASYEFSKDRIAENERQRLRQMLASVLKPSVTERDSVQVRLEDTQPDLLGSEDPVDIYVLLNEEEPVATVIAAVAPNGYNASIQLLVGLSPDGEITGVRVVSHRETPGLGDLIERSKSDWITQFDGKRLNEPPDEQWAVAPDGGAFDALTGATVTPRAVVTAVHNTLLYFEMNRERLFAEAASAPREQADE